MPHPPRVAVQKAQQDEIPQAEVGERPQIRRKPVVEPLGRLERLARERVHRLALGIPAMLFAPPVHRVEVVVREFPLQAPVAPLGRDDVLVHRPVLAASDAALEEAHHGDVRRAAEADLASAKNARARERERGHVRRQTAVRDQFLHLLAGLRVEILVRVEPQNPCRPDRQVVERPVELLGIQPRPVVVDDRRAHLRGDLVAAVRRMAVDDEDLPRREWRQPLQAPPDVEFFVLLQDDDREICHANFPIFLPYPHGKQNQAAHNICDPLQY